MSDRSYIGVTFKGVGGENLKAIFPDGTFSIINNAGKLMMQMQGAAPDTAMAIETVQAYVSVIEAVAWVQV
jgi:hypothetical protein